MPPNDPKDGKRGQGLSPDRASAKRPSGKSWFFGVGINQYAHFSPLNNAVKDVKDLLILLQDQYGFDPKQTITLFDDAATRDNIIDELDALIKKVSPEDKLLLYYSGHGHLNRPVNLAYWIPQDARKDRTSGYIPNSTVRDYIKAIPALHTLLISDSCFSGTLFVRGTSRSDEAADELEQRRSRWGIVSGRHDEEVYDGEPGMNSPFAASILKVLGRNREAKLNVARLADQVVEMTRANYKQLPEGNPLFGVGHDGGQYLFRLAASESNLWERCQAEHSLAAYNDYLDQFSHGDHADAALRYIREIEEAGAWQRTERIKKIYSYRTFLRSFPAGKYAAEAHQRIRQLQEEEQGHEAINYWETVKEQDTKEGYSGYLRKYPNGQFASQARNRVLELEKLEQQAVLEGKVEQAWQKAQALDTIDAYETFIQQYPEHRYAKAAGSRLPVKREEPNRKPTPERKVFSQQHIHSEPITPEPSPKSPLQQYMPYALGLLLLLVLAIWLPNWNGNENTLFNLIPFESSENRYGYKNEAGEVVITAQYDYAYPFSENRAVVEKDSLHGIINRNGELLTALKYQQIEAFSGGMAMVLLNDQYGFIDTTGQEVIAPQFRNAGSFDDTGEAWVQGDDKEFYIDKTGKCIRNCEEQKQVDTAPVTFPSKSTATLKGKTYPTIQFKANGLTWMAQNLDYQIDNSWCYDDSGANCNKYGLLYTWEAAKKACQAVGWRLPTDQEWRNMAKDLGGADDDASDEGKAAYKALIAGGSTGFSAQLGGYRHSNGSFLNLGNYGLYWNATEEDSDDAWGYYFRRNDGELYRASSDKTVGRSCRCVQD